VADAELHAGNRPALFGAELSSRCYSGQGMVAGLGCVRQSGRVGLRDAPSIMPRARKRSISTGGNGRAAGNDRDRARQGLLVGRRRVEQCQPHRWHTGTEHNALAGDQFMQFDAVEVGEAQHQLGADHRRGIGQAPGIFQRVWVPPAVLRADYNSPILLFSMGDKSSFAFFRDDAVLGSRKQ